MEKATFAAGCFWGVEANFRKIKGVITTTVGYTGGNFKNPTYEDVCTGNTGHAEAVDLIFDPNIVTFEQLLDVFWKIHDPTTLNRQGPDLGTQYRSAIFYHDEKQKIQALDSRKNNQKHFNQSIVTEIVPISEFYKAEEYHQQYIEKSGRNGCMIY